MHDAIPPLEQRVASQESDIQQLEDQLAASRALEARQKSTIDRLEERITGQQREIARLHDELVERRKHEHAQAQELAEQETLINRLDARVAEQQSENTSLRDDLATLSSREVTLNTKLAKSDALVEQLKQRVEEQQARQARHGAEPLGLERRQHNRDDEEDVAQSRHTLLNIALTCSAFRDPALDCLWRTLDSAVPLIRLLPSVYLENQTYVC